MYHAKVVAGFWLRVAWLWRQPLPDPVQVLLEIGRDAYMRYLRPGDHLRALENVSRCLRDDGFVRALRQATNRDAIWELLQEGENPTH